MMETTIAKKRVKIYKNGDNSFEGLDFIINTDQFKNMQELLNIINEKIGLTNGAKKLYTLNGELIQSVEQIISDKEYVAATNVFKPLLYGQMKFITSTDKIDKLTMINSEISSLAVIYLFFFYLLIYLFFLSSFHIFFRLFFNLSANFKIKLVTEIDYIIS
ncbi:unnamed protein product [Brugia pahangi]|uniref:Doublecortin domain-containing protein n=1 Tax=Brugia pahangi TaxID=6280 RepID=A0A0N4TYR9_BRUPA|nr:unnamed protein product [Brugia pahangi]